MTWTTGHANAHYGSCPSVLSIGLSVPYGFVTRKGLEKPELVQTFLTAGVTYVPVFSLKA